MPDDFFDMNPLKQLDIIGDWLGILTVYYNEAFEDFEDWAIDYVGKHKRIE